MTENEPIVVDDTDVSSNSGSRIVVDECLVSCVAYRVIKVMFLSRK